MTDEISEDPLEGTEEDKEEKQDQDTYDYQQGYGYPEPGVKDSIFKFFRDILQLDDSTKTSFLDKPDLYNVRLYKDTSLYLEKEGCMELKDYFDKMAENILATAMSKDGFFLNTTVTQVRKVQRIKNSEKIKKSGIFNFNKGDDEDGKQ